MLSTKTSGCLLNCFRRCLLVGVEAAERAVCNLDGAQDRRASVRAARGHCRGESQDGDDRVCLPHDP